MTGTSAQKQGRMNDAGSYLDWLQTCASSDEAHIALLLQDADFSADPNEFGETVVDAWSLPEWPERILGRHTWIQLFRTAGFIARPGREPPSEPVTIYRGSSWGRRRGMAWTSEVHRAQKFADRWTASGSGSGLVFETTIHPEFILAMIDDRGEAEVVVDPSGLPPIGRSSVVHR